MGQKAEVDGGSYVDGEYVESGGGEELATVGFVEDMMVEAAVVDVVMAALLELFGGSGAGVAGEVVVGEDFGEMGEIVFADVAIVVFEHGGDRGGGAAVIEGGTKVGQDEDKRASRTKRSLPFIECFQGIGEVFEIVRGEQEVVAGVRYGSEGGAFAEERLAGRFGGVEEEVFSVVGPDGVGREVAVVDGAGEGIEGNGVFRTKYNAGAADLDACLAGDAGAI